MEQSRRKRREERREKCGPNFQHSTLNLGESQAHSYFYLKPSTRSTCGPVFEPTKASRHFCAAMASRVGRERALTRRAKISGCGLEARAVKRDLVEHARGGETQTGFVKTRTIRCGHKVERELGLGGDVLQRGALLDRDQNAVKSQARSHRAGGQKLLERYGKTGARSSWAMTPDSSIRHTMGVPKMSKLRRDSMFAEAIEFCRKGCRDGHRVG